MCRTMNELEKVIADYRSLKAMKEQLEEELKAVEREIIGYMDANEKLTETGNDFTVKLSTCERRTLDSKRLEADLGSLISVGLCESEIVNERHFADRTSAAAYAETLPAGLVSLLLEV